MKYYQYSIKLMLVKQLEWFSQPKPGLSRNEVCHRRVDLRRGTITHGQRRLLRARASLGMMDLKVILPASVPAVDGRLLVGNRVSLRQTF